MRILNTPVSAKMAQGQRKWRAVIKPNQNNETEACYYIFGYTIYVCLI